MLSSTGPSRARHQWNLRAFILAVAFTAVACNEQSHAGIEDSPTSLAKIPVKLQQELSAGMSRDLLVELDENAAIGGGDAHGAVIGALTGGLASDLGDLPASDAEPMRLAAVAQRAALYHALQERVLDSVDPSQVTLLFQYENLPLLFVHVTSMQAALVLANLPEVLRVHDDARLQHELTESLPLIHQPQAAAAGKTGVGTSVAVLDTGCDFTRTAFGSCATAGATGCKVAYAADFATDDGSRDDNGHGTNVSAIVLGVAPGAKVLALDVFDGSSAPSSAILQAVDWTITNRTTYNIVSLNLSLGGGSYTSACSTDVFASALSNARSAGIIPAVASGNSGTATALASPACAPAAVSVGAVYDSNVGGLSFPSVACTDATTAADKITCFSNSASFLSMLAPGAPITAGGYTMTGTSQASPHVAAALAVVRAAFPNEALNDSIARLTGSGPSILDPRNNIYKHRLDLQAALAGGGGVSNGPADKTGPTGSIVINSDAAATKVVGATLTITGNDPSGVSTMCISNTTACTSFGSFANSRVWSLTAGDGVKTVYVTLKDSVGNTSVFTDTIRLDATSPVGGTLTATPSSRQVALNWTAATDAGSGIAGYSLVMAPTTAPACRAGIVIYTGTATSFTHTGLVNGNLYGYHLCPVDVAGNVGTGTMTTTRPAPEFDAPRGTLVINSGATLTSSTAATLNLGATDASGTASVCIANTITCTAWVPFANSKPWTLGVSNGTATVTVWFRDIYGNTSTSPVRAKITVDTTPPSMGALTTTAGTGQIALSWTAASDTSGITSYKLVWQTGTTAPGSCNAGTLAYSGTALAFMHTGRATGNYSYRLCATDRAGNLSSGVSRSVTVR